MKKFTENTFDSQQKILTMNIVLVALGLLPYIGNHPRKKSFMDHLLWCSSRENICDLPPSVQLLAFSHRALVCRVLI